MASIIWGHDTASISLYYCLCFNKATTYTQYCNDTASALYTASIRPLYSHYTAYIAIPLYAAKMWSRISPWDKIFYFSTTIRKWKQVGPTFWSSLEAQAPLAHLTPKNTSFVSKKASISRFLLSYYLTL